MFLRLVWAYLKLPKPTPVQNDICKKLQHGAKRLIICGFRGVGKSWITVAFVLWLLLLNPELKILVVSANEKLAKDFTHFARQLIDGMEILNHLKPRMDQRDNALAFDVGPASESKDPSVKSAGITGQITGNRADVIVADDIEVPKNSYTQTLRDRISMLVQEFDAILKPGATSRIIYLGTPQTEDSLYNKLRERGYQMIIWPVRIPEKIELYAGRLSDFIMRLIERGVTAGSPVEPSRFPEDDILERQASYGLGGFALQFMLDTNPSDAEKHPLKCKDAIVDDCDVQLGPVKLVWTGSDAIEGLHCGGFDGDRWNKPMWRSVDMVPWQGKIMAIDPSGKGSDETAYAIIGYLNGQLYLIECGGFKDGFGEPTLRHLAKRMIVNRCTGWVAEENYGGGMFAQLLKPVILQQVEALNKGLTARDQPYTACLYDDEYDGWSSTRKEDRIIDTMSPVLKSHRLIVNRQVIEDDLIQQREEPQYSLIYQLTRMTRLKGTLAHEDRLEAVSMGVAYWTEKMSRDVNRAEDDRKQEFLEQALKTYMHTVINVGASDPAGAGHRESTDSRINYGQ